MYCTKCGKELDADVKFCPNCGEQVDQATLVPAEKECAVTVAQDTTAPVTEKPVKKEPKKAEFDKKKAVNSYLAIERWATPIICLATMFVLLLCSFFIGVTVEEGGIKQNTFHYFGENFRQVNQAFEGLGAEFQSQKSMLNFVNVIACIVLALNLLVQGGLAVLCGINSFKAFKSGEKPSVLKYVLWAFVSFAITATVIYSLEYAYADTEVFGMEIEVGSKMSGGSIAGLIIGAIFLFIVYTMQKLKEGKAVLDKNYLIKLGIVTLTLIFAVITFSTLGKCVYKTFSSTSDSGMTMSMTMKYSAASYLNYAISETLGTQGVEYGLEFATVIVNMLAIAGAAVLFAKIFMAFMTDRELGKRDFITAIVATALSLVNLIVACVAAGDIGADLVGATFSAGRTVVPFIFSLLTLGAIIARGFFNKEKPTVEDNSKNEETVVVEESTSQIEEQTAK